MTAGEEVVVALDCMLSLSQVMARDVEDYRHCEYQAAMAAVIASRPGKVTVAVAPTGSGKTWVQGLVAKHFCSLGQKVVVVEPTDALMQQAAEKLALVDYGITVTTMKRLYEEGPWTDVTILDEYDTIVEKSAYLVQQQGIRGLWQLRGKRVFAFSATSSISHERLLGSLLEPPTTVKLKSEYEMVHGVSPVGDASVIVCSDQVRLEQQLQADLEKRYDIGPVIVILDEE